MRHLVRLYGVLIHSTRTERENSKILCVRWFVKSLTLLTIVRRCVSEVNIHIHTAAVWTHGSSPRTPQARLDIEKRKGVFPSHPPKDVRPCSFHLIRSTTTFFVEDTRHKTTAAAGSARTCKTLNPSRRMNVCALRKIRSFVLRMASKLAMPLVPWPSGSSILFATRGERVLMIDDLVEEAHSRMIVVCVHGICSTPLVNDGSGGA